MWMGGWMIVAQESLNAPFPHYLAHNASDRTSSHFELFDENESTNVFNVNRPLTVKQNLLLLLLPLLLNRCLCCSRHDAGIRLVAIHSQYELATKHYEKQPKPSHKTVASPNSQPRDRSHRSSNNSDVHTHTKHT